MKDCGTENMSKKFNKAFFIVGGSKMISAALVFVRMAILARILSPYDFGVAATFWITTGVLAAITEIGIDKILVQNKDGDKEHFASVAQTLLLIRGVLIAGMIFLLSGYISRFFDLPNSSGDFALLAIIPLLKGFENRGYIQKQRSMNFVPLAIIQLTPDLVSTAIAYPLAIYFNDYRSFIYISIVSGIASLIVSYAVGGGSRKFAWDKEIIVKMIVFGWPLAISSLLLMLTLQGDKIIISQYYSKYELGLFAVAFSFATFLPNNLGNVFAQIVLPFFSKIRDDAYNLSNKLRNLSSLVFWISLASIVFLMGYSEELMRFFYGERYAGVSGVVSVLVVVFFIRLIRQIPNTICMAYGDTVNIMYSNIYRQTALILTLYLAAIKVDMYLIAAVGIIGELFAMVSISYFLRGRVGENNRIWMKDSISIVAISSISYISFEWLRGGFNFIVLYLIVSSVVVFSFFKIKSGFARLG